MLPLIRSIVRDIVEDFRTLQEKSLRLRQIQADAGRTGRETQIAMAKPLSDEIAQLTRGINEMVEEVGRLGVEFKGYEEGLADFPTRRGGEIVYLCWKLGEEHIGYWHPLDTGFAGRRPIDDSLD